MASQQDLLKVHSAVRWGKSVDELKAAGLTDKNIADARDEGNGNSAIQIAVQNGHTEIVKYLIELKIDVNTKNNSGNTALHMGVEYDYYPINKMLLAAGADGSVTNNEDAKAIEGLSGSKTGPEAWDNPVTVLKTVDDDVAALEEVFKALEVSKAEDIKKDELVRVGMMKKKELKKWAEGGFQSRFTDLVRKL
jgi:hypothetical protein